MLAGAFTFAKPNGNFARAFPGASREDAQKTSAAERFLNGRHYDQLVNDQGKIAVCAATSGMLSAVQKIADGCRCVDREQSRQAMRRVGLS